MGDVIIVIKKWFSVAMCSMAVAGLAGCSSSGLLDHHDTFAVAEQDAEHGPETRVEKRLAAKRATNDYPKKANRLRDAQLEFAEGNYGKAAEMFQRAAEETPRDPNVWLGLAASYDNIRRFDLADRAYRQVRRLVGNSVTVRNNLGYSYMLRGKLSHSRRELLAAYSVAPDNPFVLNNIAKLNEKLVKLGRPTIGVAAHVPG